MKGQGYLYGRPEEALAVRDRLAALGLLKGENETSQTGDTTEAGDLPGQRQA